MYTIDGKVPPIVKEAPNREYGWEGAGALSRHEALYAIFIHIHVLRVREAVQLHKFMSECIDLG